MKNRMRDRKTFERLPDQVDGFSDRLTTLGKRLRSGNMAGMDSGSAIRSLDRLTKAISKVRAGIEERAGQADPRTPILDREPVEGCEPTDEITGQALMVYRTLSKYPDSTAAELGAAMAKDYPDLPIRVAVSLPPKKLKILEELGEAKRGGMVVCTESGRQAQSWYVAE